MRDRLIELIGKEFMSWVSWKAEMSLQGSYNTPSAEECIADKILADGWMKPPCKVGNVMYWLTPYGVEELTVDLIKIIGNQEIRIRARRFVKEIVYFSLEHFGKTVFLTREEAERALKGGAE